MATGPSDLLSVDNVGAVRISSRADIRRAAEAFAKIIRDGAQMRVAVAHDIANKETPVDADGAILARDVFGWDDADASWWNTPEIALRSPIITACRFESEPFWVNSQGFRTRWPNPYLDAISLSNFEQRAMAQAAIVVPVHLTFGKIGAVSFHPDDERIDLEEPYEHFSEAFGMMARAFVSSYVHVMAGLQRLPSKPRLSKREIECLRWVALGKTDDEIGMIMDRSRATVRFHIQNASTKLDAVNRSQAVFKATQLGFISLHA